MGTLNVPSATDGTVIPASNHNSLRNALLDNLVCRNASGNATDLAGDLGTSSVRWKDSYIQKVIVGLASNDVTIQEGSAALKFIIGGSTQSSLNASTHDMDIANDYNYRIGGATKFFVDSNGTDGQYLKDQSVSTAAIADGAVTKVKTTPNYTISSSCGAYSDSTIGWTTVTNLSVAITTVGNPVVLQLIPVGTEANPTRLTSGGSTTYLRFAKSGVSIANWIQTSGEEGNPVETTITVPTAGTHTYTFDGNPQGGATFTAEYWKLVAYEL